MFIVINKTQKEGSIITDAKEVANIVGISRATLYNWLDKAYSANYVEDMNFIIIRDPQVIKSNKGGKDNFIKNLKQF